MTKPYVRLLIRWLVCSLGLWIAAGFLATRISYSNGYVIIIAGFILAIINIFLKPVLVAMALPVIFFSLGLFTIIINGLTVFLASKLYTPFHVADFWAAIFAGMVIGLVNYLVSTIIER